jgi:hypothetical protein
MSVDVAAAVFGLRPTGSDVSARARAAADDVVRADRWPLVCVSGIAVMFGAFEPSGVAQGIATIPEIIWEAFLGLYLTFKGFNMASPVFDGRRDTEGDPDPAIAAS